MIARAALALAAALVAAAAALPARAGDLVAVEPRPVAVTVQDRSGRDLSLADVRGELTLLHFWASWCGSCRTEFPAIDALQRDLRDRGVRVVAVSLDRLGWPAIDKTVESLGIRDVGLYHDVDRRTSQALGVAGLPTTVVVDRDGREVARIIGAGAWEDPALRARLEALGRR